MTFNFAQIKNAFPQLATEFAGPIDTTFSGVSSPENPVEGTLVFCSKLNFVEQALASSAAGIVVPQKIFGETSGKAKDHVIISSPNPELLMAKTIDKFILQTPYRDYSRIDDHLGNHPARHPSAVVAETAEIDPSATIAPGVVIGHQVKIGPRVYVGANSVIEAQSEIGEGTTIQALVVIGTRVKIGARCEIGSHTIVGKEGFGYAHDAVGNHVRIPHQGWVIIEDDVNLGAVNTVDRGTFGETRIGRGTKTDNQVHIAHNCTIGRGCLLTSGFKIAGSSSIGNFIVTGGNTLISGHLHVTDGVNISAGSAVGKSIDVKGDYGGLPLLPLQQHLRVKAAMVQLPEMRKQVKKLMEKIFPESEKD